MSIILHILVSLDILDERENFNPIAQNRWKIRKALMQDDKYDLIQEYIVGLLN